MAGSYPTDLIRPKGAVGQNGTGSAGAYPVDLGQDKGAVGHVTSSVSNPHKQTINIFRSSIVKGI